jgi:putative spermidine/putrescine transport system permease protein
MLARISKGGTVATRSSPILLLLTVIVSIFMSTPMILSITAGLVNNYSRGLSSGLTLRWLEQVWASYGPTVGWSLAIAAACVIGNLIIGLPCAYALARTKSQWARAFEEIITLPVAIPGLATGLALILTYGQFRDFRQSFLFILVGHMVFTLPFMVRTLSAAFQRKSLIELEEASSTLGASFIQTMFTILIPAIFPAMIAASLMVVTLSIGEFNLTWMLHTPLTRTLPVGLADSYASMRIEVGSAYTLIFFIVVLPLLWCLQYAGALVQRKYET